MSSQASFSFFPKASSHEVPQVCRAASSSGGLPVWQAAVVFHPPGGPGPHMAPSAATCAPWHLLKEDTWREEGHGEEGEIM